MHIVQPCKYSMKAVSPVGTTTRTQDLPAAKCFLTKTQRDQKSSGNVNATFSKLYRDSVVFYFLAESPKDSLKRPNG